MELNLSTKLDFSEKDLTAPDIVINSILSDLPNETNDIIYGKIESYNGHIFSYTQKGLSSISFSLGTADKTIDVQDSLGASGETNKTFECYIYTPVYNHYKYRLFFIRYGIAHYPVTIVLEDSISRSISPSNSNYIYKCNDRGELEELVESILTSKRVLNVMQEIITINQAKKDELQEITEDDESEEDVAEE